MRCIAIAQAWQDAGGKMKETSEEISANGKATNGEMVEAFAHPMTTASAKAQRDLGYKVVPLKEMVKDCYDWIVAEGRI